MPGVGDIDLGKPGEEGTTSGEEWTSHKASQAFPSDSSFVAKQDGAKEQRTQVRFKVSHRDLLQLLQKTRTRSWTRNKRC